NQPCGYGLDSQFAASGSHKVIFNGGSAQTISFGCPGAVTSHFQNLEIANTNGGVSLNSAAFANGNLDVTTATTVSGNATVTAAGNVTTVTGGSLTVSALTFGGALSAS